jgi:hypothetical protein
VPGGGGGLKVRIRSDIGALLSRKARSRAVGHVSAPESSLTGRRGLKLQDTRQHVVAYSAPCLSLMPAYRLPDL